MFEKKVGRPSNETVKKRRIFKVSMFLLAIAVVASIVGGITYARYKTQSESANDVDVAKWNITWSSDGTATFAGFLQLTPVSSEYVASGKVAPSSLFDATYVINPGDTEVSVESSFAFDTSNTISINDTQIPITLVSASYEIDGVTTNLNLTTETQDDYVGHSDGTAMLPSYYTIESKTYKYPTTPIIIPLSKIKSGDGLTTVTLRFSIDDTDINLTGINSSAPNFPINLVAQQKRGAANLTGISNIKPATTSFSAPVSTTTSSN